jgi:hypothetical protein
VIRFNCPNCSRRYELPDALAHLPLVCKGCGQPLAVPAPTPDPEPEPEPEPERKPVAPKPTPAAVPVHVPRPAIPPAPPAAAKPREAVEVAPPTPPATAAKHADGPPASVEVNGDDFLFAKPDSSPDIDFDATAPPTTDRNEVANSRPLPSAKPAAGPKPPAPATRARTGSKLLAVVVDVVIGLILLAVGVFLGEVLAKQSTGEVLKEAGSAAKFPPLELILWMAPPLLLALVYGLLVSRGRSVGYRLRR